MKNYLTPHLIVLLSLVFAVHAWAGGSGFNVVVVVNQNSTNSVQLGNYYMQQRHVPPQNLLRINWTGSSIEWALSDFNNTLLNPFLAMLSSRQLTNQVDYVVLSMDIPYRINNVANNNDDYNSTTSALFYGYKTDPHSSSTCDLAAGSTNLYAGSESIFRLTPPTSANSNSWLVTMLASSNNLAQAEMTVLQGATSDGTFPTQTVLLAKAFQPQEPYVVRHVIYDNAVFDTMLRGNYSVVRVNGQGISSGPPLLGAQAGAYSFGISASFVPGAMADNLNSFGGQFLESPSGESVLLNFLSAGASGSYGTVVEPCNFIEKFPDPENYLYQARGFSLAECYYQSVTNPYQGMVAGEPLAAPFAQPGSGSWSGIASNAILSGTTNLAVQFTASDAQHPLQSLDLFVDGTYLKTVTNISPQINNVLKVTLNGFPTNLTAPASSASTIKTLASNLVNTLNTTGYENNTKVRATAHGDRIELQSTAGVSKTGAQISLAVSSTNSSGTLNSFIFASGAAPTNFLGSIAEGTKGYTVAGSLLSLSTLSVTVTKTNNSQVTVTVTNNGNANLTDFTQQFVDAIDAATNLQGLDGISAADVETDSLGDGLFSLYANGPGFAAAQIKANITGGFGPTVTPTGANTFTDNLNDLEPRNHLYIACGVSNLNLTFPLATTNLTDGYHELAAVAYEGTSVHTQTRATQDVIVKNTALSATLAPLLTGTNSSPEPTLQFTVTANTNNISAIQLFSTGGLLATVSGQFSATFAVTLSNLDVGVHPFYAIVTDNTGKQYRTQTQTVGLVGVTFSGSSLLGVDLPFPLQISKPPLLVWPATAGRAYNILSSTNLTGPFTTRLTVIPTSSLGQWLETNTTPAQQFYRVSVAP